MPFAAIMSMFGLYAACNGVLFPISGMGQSDYPNQPITLIVGFNAGGNTDIGLRILADSASKILGQPVVVDGPLAPEVRRLGDEPGEELGEVRELLDELDFDQALLKLKTLSGIWT